MARKTAQTEPGEPQRTKHLNADQCKVAAAKISVERRSYEADVARYAQAQFHSDPFLGSFLPIWPADYDLCVEKINRLYHPEEAELIIAGLTA